MTPLSVSVPLSRVDLSDTAVCKWITEMLPMVEGSDCHDQAVPFELVRETAKKVTAGTVADLVLELAIMLTGGFFAQTVKIDLSALTPVNVVNGPGALDKVQWAQLDLDLSRPDWTVAVRLRALPEVTRPVAETDGVVRVRVRADLDLRDWLTEEGTRAMLHEWYVRYQASGTLPFDRQVVELPQPPSI